MIKLRLASLLALMLNFSCSSEAVNKSTGAAAPVDVFGDIASSWTPRVPAAQMQAWEQVSVGRYYATLLLSTTDDQILLDGRTIGAAHTALLRAAPLFAQLQLQYGSVGAMLADVPAMKAPNTQDISDDFAYLSANYEAKRGWFSAAAAASGQPRQLGGGDVAQDTQLLRNIDALETLAGRAQGQGGDALALSGKLGDMMHGTSSKVPSKPIAQPGCPNPSGATIYKWPKSNFGLQHVAIGVSYGNRSAYINYPKKMGSTTLETTNGRHGYPAEALALPPVSQAQADNLFAALDNPQDPQMQSIVNGTNYNLFTNNCAHAVQRISEELGQNLREGSFAMTPQDIWDAGEAYNENYYFGGNDSDQSF